MINIALVDDEPAILDNIRKYIECELTSKDETEIFVYMRAKDFLREFEQGNEFDILISDINMPEINGIELGRRIREKGGRMYLVFLTAYLEYAAESYTLEAYQYILKKDMEKRLPPILSQLMNRVKREKKQFRMIGTPTNKIQVYYRDIIYIEKEKGEKYICYITVGGTHKERISLKKLNEELISDEFCLVERGYIINVTHIAGIKYNVIEMDNGTEIVVNKTNLKKVKEQISLYRGNL